MIILITWFTCGTISALFSIKLQMEDEGKVVVKDIFYCIGTILFGYFSLFVVLLVGIVYLEEEYKISEIVIWKKK